MTDRILGPLRERRTRRWWYASATLVAAVAFAVLFVASSGAVVTGSPSGFESNDGNMVLNNTDGSHTDWNCFVGSDNFQSGTPNTNCKVKTGATHVTADANGEISWVNGQKFDTQCPALAVNNNPPKDEFSDVAAFSDTASNSDVFFYGAAIRPIVNGNASGDVELNQVAGNGTTTAGCRTAGDRLIAYDFLNGGTSLSFHVLTWIDSAHPNLGGNSGTCLVKTDSMPCWGANVITPDGSQFDGEANQAAITAANNGLSGAVLPINAFAEFGINLTQALGLTGCINLPQQVWESRSSGSSFTSNPQDIEITRQPINTCASITIIKHTNPRGVNQVFSYTSNLPANATAGGVNSLPCTAAGVDGSGKFCLNDSGNTTTDNSANTVTEGLLVPGGYTVTEGADPTGFGFGSVSCTNNGSPATNVVISGKQVTITLASGDNEVCTYVNNQQHGAIKVTKTSTKGSAALPGVTFRFKKGATTLGDVVTDSNGVACMDSLAFGTDYSVQEISAPTGYKINDATAHTGLVVNANAACSDTSFGGVSLSFDDTPLSTITLGFHSLAGAGVTSATVQCTGEGSAANLPEGDATKTLGNGTSTLVPGNYSCTVIVDP